MIEFKQVSKRFEQVDALKNISLTIHQGDFFGVIGMSGAGKSTLVRLINGLIKPDDGQVLVNNQNINELKDEQLKQARSKIGMIFQHFNLLSQQSVLENVCLPLKLAGVSKKERHAKGLKLLAQVGLKEKAHAYPSQLSGGQKQRVAIARALINDCPILLCDEATSALDPISTQAILDLLKSLQKEFNLTIVMITHEMKLVQQVCNKVAILDNGELIEEGTIEDIFTHPKHPKTKKLLFVEEPVDFSQSNQPKLRLIFDGISVFEPIISDLILTTKQSINIIWANTNNIDEKVYGQMLIQVERISEELMNYLESHHVSYQVEGQA